MTSAESDQKEQEKADSFFGKIGDAFNKAKDTVMDSISMESQLKRARETLEDFLSPKKLKEEEMIPKAVLRGAQGIVFMTVGQIGAGIAGGGGG